MKKILSTISAAAILAATVLLGPWTFYALAQTQNNPGVPIFNSGGTGGAPVPVLANSQGIVVYPPNFAGMNSSNLVINWSGINNAVFISTNGNDVTALPGRPEYPCATWTNAKSMAFNLGGGTIIAEPGTYTNNDLLTNGVNYLFLPGAKVVYVQPDTNDLLNGSSWGIFDDRHCGPTSNKIAGWGDFSYLTYTGAVFTSGQLVSMNPSTRGVFIVTNNTSRISAEGQVVQIDNFTGQTSVSALFVQDASLVRFNFKKIVSQYPAGGTNLFWRISNSNAVAGNPNAQGIFWTAGPTYCSVDEVQNTGNYGIWMQSNTNLPDSVTNAGDFWYWGRVMGTKIYIENSTSTNNLYRGWIHIDDLEMSQNFVGDGSACSIFGTGKYYLDFKKVQNRTNSPNSAISCLDDAATSSVTSNGTIWLNAQKMASNCRFINLHGATTVFANIGQLEDLGIPANSAGISTANNCNLYLGVTGPIIMSNAPAVSHGSSGVCRLEGITINAFATTSNAISCANSNLILQNCTLIVSNSAFAINASSAQTVGSYNTFSNGTNSPNISTYGVAAFSPGFYTNAAVQ